ncbi:MAG: indole-3-glycerol-phosphate synthase [Betaproteobacteria bacterium RIFCSPHIGHO2_12_FULL_69_13]|nr:MAG: indole-3-glycerol-phosphate synthase [Betaproteobacteria bacterium RIFCSPHIGHO2_12_FULL_69_13]OGA70754.1 MAG: indole-3-glycerol-phosphate synthase [Betaproteobacteria bacterium RIFCSPLOWO2_12_FULL_68_20]
MGDVLERIVVAKRAELAQAKAARPRRQLEGEARAAAPARDFVGAMRARIASGRPAVIAEIKRASPSRGVLREDFDPGAIAQSYEAGGATCMSVLTDKQFFQGALEHLKEARAACNLPVLRKDFMLDPYQIFESRAAGADAILLIAASLDAATMRAFEALAHDLGMAVLVEAHDVAELEAALALRTPLIGINNRDLGTFETRLETTLELAPRVPKDRIVVTESGILSPADVGRMRSAGVNAFLVGEAFMRSPDPGGALRAMFFEP